jgi:hypothetical protein
MSNAHVVCVPLSDRKAIPRLWTSDIVYVNCYECEKVECRGVCVYVLLNDTAKNLCPHKGGKPKICGAI